MPRIALSPLGHLPYVLAATLFVFPTSRAAAADEPTGGVLHLHNGGYVPGALEASDKVSVLRWRAPLFTESFEFPLSALTAVHYSPPPKRPKPTGEYCFELIGDDVLFGDLVDLTADELTLQVAQVGRIQVRREHVRRFFRWQEAGLIYLGPSGLLGWSESGDSKKWRDDGGLPVTDQPGASIYSDFQVPEKALIEFALSWKRKPDFVLALGVDDQVESVQRAFRFEVWDTDFVAIAESKRDSDLAPVAQFSDGSGRIRIQAYLDQPRQRLLLFSPGGKPLAKLGIQSKKPPVGTGLRLTNIKGHVRLDSLRISRWNGVPPQAVQADKSRIHLQDSSIVYGQLAAFDAKSKQFIVRDGQKETQIKAETITDVFLSPPLSNKSEPSTEPAQRHFQRTIRLEYQDGSRFSGEPTRIESSHVSLECPGVVEPLRLPLRGLRSLISSQRRDLPPASSRTGRSGRLELEGLRLPGRLVDGRNQPEASCLVWHPDLARKASPIRHGVTGRIVYRDPSPKQPAKVQTQQQRRGAAAFAGRAVPGRPVRSRPAVSKRIGDRSLHLRSGDTIPCEVTGINAKGVTFESAISDATFVPHEKIKAIELSTSRGSPSLDEMLRQRLLTLPRLLKNSPPTHLICSNNGDFLRARVLKMDDKLLKAEVRLEEMDIPRDRVAQIIWLHKEELSGETTPAVAAAFSKDLRVQSLRADGNRLTFVAERFQGQTLTGTSELLGACRIDVSKIDQLLIGSYIEQAAAKLAYHRWKLHHAVEPKFVQVDGDSVPTRPSGTDSPLVGQPAPDFKLPLLSGKDFRLADHKGQIIILDFWATWCGPCLQTMPLIDRIAGEYEEKGVRLFAVNMEEQRKQIQSMLERHKLEMTVALDRDGVVASRYAVTAIPQTVIIDREGKVARLFVGGGPKLAEPLREALEELTGEQPSPPDSP